VIESGISSVLELLDEVTELEVLGLLLLPVLDRGGCILNLLDDELVGSSSQCLLDLLDLLLTEPSLLLLVFIVALLDE
jgi:hypothetical protein